MYHFSERIYCGCLNSISVYCVYFMGILNICQPGNFVALHLVLSLCRKYLHESVERKTVWGLYSEADVLRAIFSGILNASSSPFHSYSRNRARNAFFCWELRPHRKNGCCVLLQGLVLSSRRICPPGPQKIGPLLPPGRVRLPPLELLGSSSAECTH